MPTTHAGSCGATCTRANCSSRQFPSADSSAENNFQLCLRKNCNTKQTQVPACHRRKEQTAFRGACPAATIATTPQQRSNPYRPEGWLKPVLHSHISAPQEHGQAQAQCRRLKYASTHFHDSPNLSQRQTPLAHQDMAMHRPQLRLPLECRLRSDLSQPERRRARHQSMERRDLC